MSSLCLCSVIHKTFLRFNIAETASKSQGDIKRLKRADTAESGGGKVQSLNVHLSYVSASAVLIKVSAKFRCDFHNIRKYQQKFLNPPVNEDLCGQVSVPISDVETVIVSLKILLHL